MAAQYGSSDVIHVELHSRRMLDVWVRGHQEQEWTRLDFDANTWWELQGNNNEGSIS